MNIWDVKLEEQVQEMGLRRQIETVRAELDFIARSEAIRTAPGFDAFVAQLERLREVAIRRYVSDKAFTNEGLREQRGYVQALGDVLGLATSSKATETLATRLSDLQDQLNEALRRRPKLREAAPT